MHKFWVLCTLRNLRKEREEKESRESQQCNRRRLRSLRDATDPFALPEERFKRLYRLSRTLARSLVEELRPYMPQAKRSTAIPVEFKVLCALYFFGNGSYQKRVGSESTLALCQRSVCTAVEEVTTALNNNVVLSKWIVFPLTSKERQKLILRNYRSSGIPGVIGFLDGTHVAIRNPKEEEDLFLNRMSYHSINVMIVCDSEMEILNCLAHYGGNNHNSYIWSKSKVKELLVDVWDSGEQCWLLGDAAYPLEPWLLTPILDAPDCTPEANYTKIHTQARSVVDKCIGVLKARFRCLLRHHVLEYTPSKAERIINACAVLHNMCHKGGLNDDLLPEESSECKVPQEKFVEEEPKLVLTQKAKGVRQSIIWRLQLMPLST